MFFLALLVVERQYQTGHMMRTDVSSVTWAILAVIDSRMETLAVIGRRMETIRENVNMGSIAVATSRVFAMEGTSCVGNSHY